MCSAPSASPCGRRGSYGAVSALGVLQILPLLVIVALLRWLEIRVHRGTAPSGERMPEETRGNQPA